MFFEENRTPHILKQIGKFSLVNIDDEGSWLKGSILLNQFILEKKLGEGGYGDVWYVKDIENGKEFAVKKVRPQKNVIDILDELKIFFDIPKHPHLLSCHFFYSFKEQIFYS